MSTKLQKQLQKLKDLDRKVGGTSVNRNERPSLLMDSKEAADQDLHVLIASAQTSLAELIQINPAFAKYQKSIFSDQFLSYNRVLKTKEENASLDKEIHRFLYMISPYFLLKPSFVLFEYLLARFQIHVWNVEQILLMMLPYHETDQFLKFFGILKLEGLDRWAFLLASQKNKILFDRQFLVSKCTDDPLFLDILYDFMTSDLEGARTVKSYLSFFVILVIECLKRNNCPYEKFLPLMVKGFKNKNQQVLTGFMLILMEYSVYIGFENPVLDAILSHIVQHCEDEKKALITIIWTLERQKKFHENFSVPDKTFKCLVRMKNLKDSVRDLVLKFEIDFFTRSFILKLSQYCYKHENYANLLLEWISEESLANLPKDVKVTVVNEIVSGYKEELCTSAVIKLLSFFESSWSVELESSLKNVQVEKVDLLKKLITPRFAYCQSLENTFFMGLQDANSAIRKQCLSLIDSSSYISLKDVLIERLEDSDREVAKEAWSVLPLSKMYSQDELCPVVQSCLSHADSALKKLVIDKLKSEFKGTLTDELQFIICCAIKKYGEITVQPATVIDKLLKSKHMTRSFAKYLIYQNDLNLDKEAVSILYKVIRENFTGANHMTFLFPYLLKQTNLSPELLKEIYMDIFTSFKCKKERLFEFLKALGSPLSFLYSIALDKSIPPSVLSNTTIIVKSYLLAGPVADLDAFITFALEALHLDIKKFIIEVLPIIQVSEKMKSQVPYFIYQELKVSINLLNQAKDYGALLSFKCIEKNKKKVVLVLEWFVEKVRNGASTSILDYINSDKFIEMKSKRFLPLVENGIKHKAITKAYETPNDSNFDIFLKLVHENCFELFKATTLDNLSFENQLKFLHAIIQGPGSLKKAFENVKIIGSHIQEYIMEYLEFKLEDIQASKSRKKASAGAEKIKGKEFLNVLDFLHGHKLTTYDKDIMDLFSEILSYLILDQSEIDYILLLMMQIFTEKLTSSERSFVRVDILIQLLRTNQNPQIHHEIFNILAILSNDNPENVVHSVMPIFTFMGTNTLKLDDDYSEFVIEKTIQSILPNVSVSTLVEIMNIFIDSYAHIPKHRRLTLFSVLSKQNLFLLWKCMLASSKLIELEFIQQLFALFEPVDRVNIMTKMLNEPVASKQENVLEGFRKKTMEHINAIVCQSMSVANFCGLIESIVQAFQQFQNLRSLGLSILFKLTSWISLKDLFATTVQLFEKPLMSNDSILLLNRRLSSTAIQYNEVDFAPLLGLISTSLTSGKAHVDHLLETVELLVPAVPQEVLTSFPPIVLKAQADTDKRHSAISLIAESLGLKFLPFLPQVMAIFIQDLTKMKTATFVCAVQRFMKHLCSFLSPYLGPIISFSLSIENDSLLTDIVEKIETRIVVANLIEFMKTEPKVIEHAKYFEMFSKAINLMDKTTFANHHQILFKFVIEVAEKVQGQSFDQLIQFSIDYVLKMNEKMFEPLFLKLVEWSDSRNIKQRHVFLYTLINSLFNKLKSIFTPYFQLVLEHCLKQMKNPEIVEPIMLDCMHSSVLYDNNDYIQETYEVMIDPIIELIKERYDEPIYREKLVKIITQIAVTGNSDSIWKPLNQKVLSLTRESVDEVRKIGLEIQQEFYDKLGEDFLILLPETIPYLAELLEDENEQVEKLTRKLIETIEVYLGEPLKKYFE